MWTLQNWLAVIKLYSDEQLRKDLTRSVVGSLTNKYEADVLAVIKKLAVREEKNYHGIVAKVTASESDEPVRGFGACLREQAGVCKFLIKCPGCDVDVNYTMID